MELLPPEIICYINDFMHIIDQIHFSQINKFHYQSVEINRDLPHLLLSRHIANWFGADDATLFELSSFIKLDYLRSYLDKLETELKLLELNPPKGFWITGCSDIYIVVLVHNKTISRNPINISIRMDIDSIYKIYYNKHNNFSTLIRDLIDIYEVKKNTKNLQLLQEYYRDE
jgi:hypothetical protein